MYSYNNTKSSNFPKWRMLVTLKRLNLLLIQSRIIFYKNKRYLEGFSRYLENLSAIFKNFWNDIQAILRDIC